MVFSNVSSLLLHIFFQLTLPTNTSSNNLKITSKVIKIPLFINQFLELPNQRMIAFLSNDLLLKQLLLISDFCLYFTFSFTTIERHVIIHIFWLLIVSLWTYPIYFLSLYSTKCTICITHGFKVFKNMNRLYLKKIK